FAAGGGSTPWPSCWRATGSAPSCGTSTGSTGRSPRWSAPRTRCGGLRNMATLSELVAERRDLEADAAENEGIIEESLEALWEENEAAIEDKVEAWGHVLRERAADIEVIDAEIKRLQERKRVRQG